jgi:hypothetical protein
MVTPGIAIEQPSRSGLFQRMRRKRQVRDCHPWLPAIMLERRLE